MRKEIRCVHLGGGISRGRRETEQQRVAIRSKIGSKRSGKYPQPRWKRGRRRGTCRCGTGRWEPRNVEFAKWPKLRNSGLKGYRTADLVRQRTWSVVRLALKQTEMGLEKSEGPMSRSSLLVRVGGASDDAI